MRGHTGDVAGRVHRAYVWVRNGQVHYRRSGPGGARSPLVLLHPAQSSSACFESFMSDVGRERSVIAPDLPGAGMSDPVDDGANPNVQAATVLELVAELGLGVVDVIGVRSAGAIAAEMARQQPNVVRKVILVSALSASTSLNHPTLALDRPGFPDSRDGQVESAIRDFLDK